MSEHTVLEQVLINSFEDQRFSTEEKNDLKLFLESLDNSHEMLSFTRNKAFELFRNFTNSNSDNLSAATSWLEKIIKTVDGMRTDISSKVPSAFFSPGDQCLNRIISSLNNATNNIDICVFTISDNVITESILNAHNAGKNIRIISDNLKAEDKGSDIFFLAEKGVPIRLDKSPNHMHHKFAIFDNSSLINGSFNWTRSATIKN
jgi:cardiolipin hydrolase